MKEAPIKGQTAFITGASSGIGMACAQQFAMHGVNVILSGRRIDRLEALAKELSKKYNIHAIPIALDVQNHEQVDLVFNQLQLEVDILVNNAGLALSTDKIQDGKTSNWDRMIDTNVKGLLYVTRAFLPSMLKKNRGHIINIGSIAGRDCYIGGNVYSATKFAVRAISQSLRLDLLGTAIRVSEIDPGAVETEFSEVRWSDKERANQLYQGFHPLSADDIADAILYCATRPSHVNVSEVVIFPQAQAAVANIHREGESAKSVFDPSARS